MIHAGTLRHGLVAILLVGAVASAERPVLRCEIDGRVVYSDVACANAETKTEVLTTLNSYTAGPSESKSALSKSASSSHTSDKGTRHAQKSMADEQARAKANCEKLENKLEAIQDKLRSGYTIGQGNRLNDQRRELESRRRQQKCK